LKPNSNSNHGFSLNVFQIVGKRACVCLRVSAAMRGTNLFPAFFPAFFEFCTTLQCWRGFRFMVRVLRRSVMSFMSQNENKHIYDGLPEMSECENVSCDSESGLAGCGLDQWRPQEWRLSVETVSGKTSKPSRAAIESQTTRFTNRLCMTIISHGSNMKHIVSCTDINTNRLIILN